MSADLVKQLRVDLERARDRRRLGIISRAAGLSYQTVIDIAAGRQQDPRLSTYEAIRRAIDETADA